MLWQSNAFEWHRQTNEWEKNRKGPSLLAMSLHSLVLYSWHHSSAGAPIWAPFMFVFVVVVSSSCVYASNLLTQHQNRTARNVFNINLKDLMTVWWDTPPQGHMMSLRSAHRCVCNLQWLCLACVPWFTCVLSVVSLVCIVLHNMTFI